MLIWVQELSIEDWKRHLAGAKASGRKVCLGSEKPPPPTPPLQPFELHGCFQELEALTRAVQAAEASDNNSRRRSVHQQAPAWDGLTSSSSTCEWMIGQGSLVHIVHLVLAPTANMALYCIYSSSVKSSEGIFTHTELTELRTLFNAHNMQILLYCSSSIFS